MAIYGWAWRHARHKVDLKDYPNVQRWYVYIHAPGEYKTYVVNKP